MYLEVVPINKSSFIKIKGKGETVEYALKMKRMPQEKIMTKLLEENKVDQKLIDDIAKIIAEFHAKAETNTSISQFGSLATIKTNWNENFDQTRNVVDKTISAASFKLISEKVGDFMNKNAAHFREKNCRGQNPRLPRRHPLGQHLPHRQSLHLRRNRIQREVQVL